MNKVSNFSIKLRADLAFAQLGLIPLILIWAPLDSGHWRWKVGEMPWGLSALQPLIRASLGPSQPLTLMLEPQKLNMKGAASPSLSFPVSPAYSPPSRKANRGGMYMKTPRPGTSAVS